MIRILFLMCFLTSCLYADKNDQMIADLETIGNTFKVHYAPVVWKKSYNQWDLYQQVENAKNFVNSNKDLTVKEYQKTVRRFFRSIKDYHCSVRFHSTEFAALPFEIIGSENRYFVTDVSIGAFSFKNPLKLGDELISINGRPVHELVLELQREEFGTDTPGTDRSLATLFMTRRFASSGSDVPKGPLEIEVQKPTSDSTKKMKLNWYHRPELITHGEIFELDIPDCGWERLMVTPFYKDICQHELSKHDLGHWGGFLPNLGEVLWQPEGKLPFRAYLFEYEGKKVGYVRIPHYIGGEDEAQQFGEIITYFEANSDALVIDQLNNPGGSVFYLYALASMLTPAPLETPKHSISLTPREVEFAVNMIPKLKQIKTDAQAKEVLGETLGGYPISLETAKYLLQFCNLMVDEWNAAHTLTKPTFLYGVDQIIPHPNVHYTKPILMLINEMDFSGGDFMPAILQDNKRAVLMGKKTAGAGGFVAKTSFPNRFGIDYFCYTASIAHRIDQNPIENLGVTPDISYELVPGDLQGGYKPFVNEILKNLGDIVN